MDFRLTEEQEAIRDAIACCGDGKTLPRIDAPATPEAVLRAVDAIRASEDAQAAAA